MTMSADSIPSQRTEAAPGAPPDVAPYNVADDAWLIPNWYGAGPGVFLPVNTMVIRGEPIVVDTGEGTPLDRMIWLGPVTSWTRRGTRGSTRASTPRT